MVNNVVRVSSEVSLAPETRSNFLTTGKKQLGTFDIRCLGGLKPPKSLHSIVLAGILDPNRKLGILVNYADPTSPILFYNAGGIVLTDTELDFGHPGLKKKRFKAGEILIPTPLHTLKWKAFDLDRKPVTVNLSIIPLALLYGVQLYYTLTPDPASAPTK